MATPSIARPEWSSVIDPVLQKELEQHVLVTSWDKLLGMIDTVYNWGRRSSLWPLGFGLACCAIEMICTASSRFDIARFGAEVFRGSPRQADVMIVSGTVTKTMMPMIARLYDQMPEPKYVISMGACASGGGPFKEGYNVVSGIDKYLPVDVYIPGCPPTPQGLLNGLIALQKKIDGERITRTPWYRGEVERDVAIPVLGPDLIDMRLLEVTAERTAQGLIEAREATLVKPAKIPAPQPEPPAAEFEVNAAAPPAAAGPSKIDLIRARSKNVAEPAPSVAAASSPGADAAAVPVPVKETGRPAAKPARKAKVAEARPSLVWLGDAGLRELAERINAELGSDAARIVRAALLVEPARLIEVARYLRDRNPIRYDYLTSLQSVHYEDCIEVTYHLDSTTTPGTLIELRVRTAEAEGQGEVPSVIGVWRGADFQEREVYDMMGVRFPGHPELKRILMWDGFAYYPLRKDYLEPYYEGPTKVLDSRVEEGYGQHFRAEEFNPYGSNTKIPQNFRGWDTLDNADDTKGKTPLPTRGGSRRLGTHPFR